MVKKCIYCSAEVSDDSIIDFCSPCGKGVWGEKMFNAIVKNMEDARDRGDLTFSNVESSPSEKTNDFSL